MKKILIYSVFLVVFLALPCLAQETGKFLNPAPQTAENKGESLNATEWLIGSWTGVLKGKYPTRTLEIKEVKKREPASDEKVFEVKGLYGITGSKLTQATMEINFAEKTPRLTFITSAKSQIVMTATNTRRMDGIFTPAKGKPIEFRLWKMDGAPTISPALASLLGTWTGTWTSGLITHMRVDFIDATGASITYAWEDFAPMNGRASWERHNAKVFEDNTIEFFRGGQYTHRYKLSTFFGKEYLGGDCDPCRWNGGPQTVTWFRSTTFPETK